MGKVESILRRMVFGVVMVLGGMAWSYDATYTAGETVTISGAGSYLVTGSGAGGVTVAANVTGVTVTYSNVTCTATALKLNSGVRGQAGAVGCVHRQQWQQRGHRNSRDGGING